MTLIETVQERFRSEFNEAPAYIVRARGVIEVELPPAGYTFEQTCINEFGAFLEALDSRGEWYHPLRDGVQILRCLDAVKRSSASGQRIELGN